jgi:hypothetical protein
VGVQVSRFSPDGRLILTATNFNLAQGRSSTSMKKDK